MRSIGLVLLTFLLGISCVQAEQGVPGVTGMGVKLGFGYATLNNTVDEFSDEESFAGVVFGAFMTYSFTPAFSLQPELLFVRKGAGGSFMRGRSWRHNYLEVPVLAKYCLSPNTKLKPSLFLGPALAVLLSAEFQSSVIGDPVDIKDAMKGTDFSFVIGGVLEYHHFAFDIRYDISLGNVYDPDEWNRLLDAEEPYDIFHMDQSDTVTNRFFSFALCYRF
jgi:hypothetical protein